MKAKSEKQQKKKFDPFPEEQKILLVIGVDANGLGIMRTDKDTFINPGITIKALEVAATMLVDALRGKGAAIDIHRETVVGEHESIEIAYKKSNDGSDLVSIPVSTFAYDAMALATIDGAIELIHMKTNAAIAKATEKLIVEPGRA